MAYNLSLEEQETMKFSGHDNARATFPDDAVAGEKMHVSQSEEDDELIPWREVPERLFIYLFNFLLY